jgi:FkbM family methyltransferase
MSRKTYSGQGQDLQIVDVYQGKKNGFFVEVGAYDGVELSNTLLLEQDYGWNGVCIECNPRWFTSLHQSRACSVVTNAVYDTDDQTLDFFDTGHGLSGLVETNQHAHIINSPVIKVQTKKLTTILDSAGAPSFIEFLSLDTEGSEYAILNAHDFDKYLFGYICVEHNNVQENRRKIRDLLVSKGYVYVRENIIDDDYIHSSLLQPNNK